MALTQAGLAKALSVTVTTVNRWEVGMRPIPEMAVRLLDCLRRRRERRPAGRRIGKSIGSSVRRDSRPTGQAAVCSRSARPSAASESVRWASKF
jgi:hypothetical protein